MPRGPCAFKQRDVTRVLKATRAAGIEVNRVEVDPVTGKIAITTNASSNDEAGELDKWISTHARSS